MFFKDVLKNYQILPIYKAGENITNYKTISLISNIRNLIEKHVKKS